MIKETYNKFKAIIKGVSDDATKDLLLNLQKSLEYCVEENSVLREVLRDEYHCRKVKLSAQQKKRLAQKAISLDKNTLEDVGAFALFYWLCYYMKRNGKPRQRSARSMTAQKVLLKINAAPNQFLPNMSTLF